MDDTAQSPGQVGQQTVSQSSVSQPPLANAQGALSVQPPVTQQATQDTQAVQELQQVVSQQPASFPMGGKEHEAVGVGGVQPSQPEVAISQEVQEAGVEAVPSGEPQLTEEHIAAGLEVVKEATPLPSGPTIVQLPEDYKAPKGFFSLFGQHVKNAATWLYLLLFKAEQQAAKQATHEKKSV